ALSILLLIGRASRPRVVEVGRVPGTGYFADLSRYPENQREPDALVVRSEGALLYFNVDHVRDRLMAIVSSRRSPVPLVVFFMGSVPYVDLAGAELLVDLCASFQRRGAASHLADAHRPGLGAPALRSSQ